MKQNYNLWTPYGEHIFTEPGSNGPDDMKIYIEFPYQPWPITLYASGSLLRLKGMVEDRNYPPPNQGAGWLARFGIDCILKREIEMPDDLDMPLLCQKYKIPLKEN